MLVNQGPTRTLLSQEGAPPAEAVHQKAIRALNFEYGLYQPLVLPTFELST